jgi:MFS family permease
VSLLDPRQARRRFILLTALRWLPVGLVLPVSVLLMRDRGVEPATIGTLLALHSGLVVALELPTGGLADVLGRRPLLLASAVLNLSCALVAALAREPWQFAAAYVLLATGRALGSGPLEAWYVDTVHAADPAADLKPGLARAGAAASLALGIGAVAGGLLPAAFPDLGSGPPGQSLLVPLAVPELAAAGVGLAYAAALLALLPEPPRTDAGSGPGRVLREVPRTVRAGLRLAVRDRLALRVLLTSAAVGVTVAALEALSPLQFSALLGGGEAASGAYGTLVAAAFLAAAGGAALGPMTCRLLGGPSAGTVVPTVLGASCLMVLAAAAAEPAYLVAAGAAYVGVYLFLGVPGAVVGEVLHGRVSAAERATMLSVQSLLLQGGAIAGALTLPRLAAAEGFRPAWAAGAAVLAGSALLLVRLPSPGRDGGRDDQAPATAQVTAAR